MNDPPPPRVTDAEVRAALRVLAEYFDRTPGVSREDARRAHDIIELFLHQHPRDIPD